MLLGRHVWLSSRTKHTAGSLERSAYILLSRLELVGMMSIGELSEAFGLDASTLNRQTKAMTREGLIERIPDPEGGIARKFRLTEDGSRRLAEARSEMVGGLDKVLADWSPEEVQNFVDCLRRFNASIEQIEGRPWPRP
nr:MarR family transcriptional regulator [Phaeacidiphilus oryzae]